MSKKNTYKLINLKHYFCSLFLLGAVISSVIAGGLYANNRAEGCLPYMPAQACCVDIGVLAEEDTLACKIDRVALMPNSPEPYEMRDWNKVAKGYDDFAFDFDATGKFLPIIEWDDSRELYDKKSFSMLSYVGDSRGFTADEGINIIGAVIGSTLAGIDKSNQNGNNFVEMCQKWYEYGLEDGIYGNGTSVRGSMFSWYGLMPNMLAFQLNYLYPNTDELPKQVLSVADNYCDVILRMKDLSPKEALPTRTDKDMGAGIGWFQYLTYTMTGKNKYLEAADLCLDHLLQQPENPLFEMLMPYGALVAARMNAELGRDYDVAKLLNWSFNGDSKSRVGWGVIADNWNGLDVSGLQGSVTDGEGYAFAMNTYQMAGAITPLARYDESFAHDIGKWMLNVANASRLFYWNAHDKNHQSSYKWSSKYDPNAVIGYEGIRKWKRGANTAIADVKTAQGSVKGDYTNTFLRDSEYQVIEETNVNGTTSLEHVWEFQLPEVDDRWFIFVGNIIDGGHKGNKFQFSISDSPDGPYTDVFVIPGGRRVNRFALYSEGMDNFAPYCRIPKEMKDKLYVKVKSSNPSNSKGLDKLLAGAMAITYTSDLGPYAQGDFVVSFIDLIEDAKVPIVMYRTEDDCTDLGIYGSSHVGILGGIVRTTNVIKILQLNLLKTDYYHAEAYPSYLYYNPHNEGKAVEIDTGNEGIDIYDAVTNKFLKRNVSGLTSFNIKGDDTRIIVLVPTGGKMKFEGNKLLINDLVVDYNTTYTDK